MTSEGELVASNLPACAAPASPPPANAGLAAWVGYYLGLQWFSDWVDSRSLFAQPQDAPTRMRRSMSSRVINERNAYTSRVWAEGGVAM